MEEAQVKGKRLSFGQYLLNQLTPELRAKYEPILRETGNLELKEKRKSLEEVAKYIRNDKEIKGIIEAIVNTFGDKSVSTENAINAICSKLVPGYASFSITCLGPYIGKMKITRGQLPTEDTLRKIPNEFYESDDRLNEELYKTLEKAYRRRFYDQPKKTVAELKAKADVEKHEGLKGLFERMYKYFRDVLEFDHVKNAKSRIRNPEYKGGDYGRIHK